MSVREINGDGVRLRPLAEAELPELIDGWDEPAGRWGATGAGAWAIADPQTDRLLGAIALDHRDASRGQTETFFWVRPDDRRRGVATAALTALGDWACTDGGWSRLELLASWPDAIAQRVAMAAGFQREGVRRSALSDGTGARQDAVVHARVAGDPPGPVPRLLPDFPGGELTDGVVTLRPLGAADLAFYMALHTVPDVVATTVPPVTPSAEKSRLRCTTAEAYWLAGIRVDLVVVDTATGTPTGGMGLFNQEPSTGQAMIGYSLMPEWRGKGYATRAARLLSLWAFAETGIARLIAGTMPTNVGSQRVLIRAGFRPEGLMLSRLPGINGTRQDDIQFVLLPRDVLNAAVG
ncbi:GNAT family N-acetyltransferase [Actinoplanes sp. NPDC049265]|uniref:GNAT family N-acetyltransferase n=1 Tax=Actinoplanes sp. NPDC049265 TaxID=3363902 RepID=UPI0037236305